MVSAFSIARRTYLYRDHLPLPDSMIDSKKQKRVIREAVLSAQLGYAPYSKFQVGAALLCSSGRVYTGCNVENASYGLTVCAERVAVFKAVSEGEKGFRALCLAVNGNTKPSVCGACRQVLSEFADDLEIICVNTAGLEEHKKLRNLLPEPFKLG
jgi:cytidine deaminase